MWTLMQVNAGQRPCHFVPLLRVVHIWICKINDLYNLTLMYFIFCTCRGPKLPALTKVVKTTSSKLRSTSRKKEGGEDGMAIQKPEEYPKPLIICKKGPVEGTPEKLVVDIEVTF